MHLSEVELIDAIEETLRADRVAHLESCAHCTRNVERLTSALRDARDVSMPEPSPLYWDHFRARVRDAIDASAPETAPAGWWRLVRGGALATAALAIVVAVAFFAVSRRPVPTPDSTSTSTRAAATTQPSEVADTVPDSDPDWALLTGVTDAIDWDAANAEGLGVRPGAAERAAEQLSRDEQQELARLIREELGEDGSL